MKIHHHLLLLPIVGLSLLTPVRADVKPAPLFQNHAVLQAGKPLPIWGQADAGEKVTASFAGQTASTVAGPDGTWKVMLKPLKVSAEPAVLKIEGKNKLELQDILVGEVWLCSGQSNMEFAVSGCLNAEAEIAAANFPAIRQLAVRKNVANTPQTQVQSNWDVCSPATVGRFTAVGYFFARELHQKLGVPVGLLHSSWGGTRIEPWTPDEAMKGAEFNFVREQWQQKMDNYPKTKAEWEAREVAAAQAEAEAKAQGVPYKKKWNPEPPNSDGRPHSSKPAALFNAMIAPLAPAALAGVLWYQGESNVGQAEQYRLLFPTMINAWRKTFAEPNLPFYWVQLANFNGFGTDEIAKLREVQTATLSVPATGQAVIIDIGEAADIHPKNKQDVGHRLALLALQKNYGQKVNVSGPVFLEAKFTGGKALITFAPNASPLVMKGPALTGFELAGADKVFSPAEARIEGSKVTVQSATVTSPVAVRYAWHNAPEAGLMNAEGLPATPFRTDQW